MSPPRTSAARRPGGSPARRPAERRGGWPVRDRSTLRPVLGIPPVAAAGIAVGATAIGVLVDLLRIGTVGPVFEIGYLAGCVLAVGWVRRRGIFLPAVQPPLLLAVVVPLMAVLIGAPTGGGAAQSVLLAGAPLINAFPAMAVTTLVVLLVAGGRLLRQRLGPDDAVGRLRTRLGRDPGGHDPDGTGRTAGPATPPRGTGPGSRPRGTGPGGSARDPGPGGPARDGRGAPGRGSRSTTPGAGQEPGAGRTGGTDRRPGGSGATARRGAARSADRSPARDDTPGRTRRATG